MVYRYSRTPNDCFFEFDCVVCALLIWFAVFSGLCRHLLENGTELIIEWTNASISTMKKEIQVQISFYDCLWISGFGSSAIIFRRINLCAIPIQSMTEHAAIWHTRSSNASLYVWIIWLFLRGGFTGRLPIQMCVCITQRERNSRKVASIVLTKM